MFLLITGGSGSGKSWIAQEFAKKMGRTESTVVLDCVAETLTEKINSCQTDVLPQQQIVDEIVSEIRQLGTRTENLIVVTNQMFSDVPGTEEDRKFLECLGQINQILAARADLFVEVVYGIPIWRKQTDDKKGWWQV